MAAMALQVDPPSSFVMAGLVPAIHVDPRDKPGDDDLRVTGGSDDDRHCWSRRFRPRADQSAHLYRAGDLRGGAAPDLCPLLAVPVPRQPDTVAGRFLHDLHG